MGKIFFDGVTLYEQNLGARLGAKEGEWGVGAVAKNGCRTEKLACPKGFKRGIVTPLAKGKNAAREQYAEAVLILCATPDRLAFFGGDDKGARCDKVADIAYILARKQKCRAYYLNFFGRKHRLLLKSVSFGTFLYYHKGYCFVNKNVVYSAFK